MSFYPDKYPENPYALNNFGLCHLNIKEAAVLITKLLYLDGGYISVEYEFKDDCNPLHDPELEKILEPYIKKTEALFINGINQGTLKPDQISRTVKETIIEEETYISEETLLKWLNERNLDIEGDWHQQYIGEKVEIMTVVFGAIEDARAKLQNPKLYEEYKQTHETDEAFTQHVKICELEAELKNYRSQSRTKPEKPLSPNERRTLLEIILGMAVDKYGYDATNPDKKSAVPKAISDSLYNAEIANPPTPETIRKKLRAAAGLEEEN